MWECENFIPPTPFKGGGDLGSWLHVFRTMISRYTKDFIGLILGRHLPGKEFIGFPIV
jgi:hypothetical protein